MKTIIVLGAIAMSSQAMSAENLITYTRGGGMSPFNNRVTIEVSDNGQMSYTHFTRTTKVKENLGKLSATAVQSLKDAIEAIDDNAKVIDFDLGKPRCMDAGSSSTTVIKGGKEIEIASRGQCHNFGLKDYSHESLNNFVKSLDILTK